MADVDTTPTRVTIDVVLSQLNDYMTLIVKLSGGALGLSVVFARQFIGDGGAQWVWLLVAAWSFWIASLACVLGSRNHLVVVLSEKIAGEPSDRVKYELAKRMFGNQLLIAGWAFLLGAVFVVAFVFSNLGLLTSR